MCAHFTAQVEKEMLHVIYSPYGSIKRTKCPIIFYKRHAIDEFPIWVFLMGCPKQEILLNFNKKKIMRMLQEMHLLIGKMFPECLPVIQI